LAAIYKALETPESPEVKILCPGGIIKINCDPVPGNIGIISLTKDQFGIVGNVEVCDGHLLRDNFGKGIIAGTIWHCYPHFPFFTNIYLKV
jgi:hypothetical protein